MPIDRLSPGKHRSCFPRLNLTATIGGSDQLSSSPSPNPWDSGDSREEVKVFSFTRQLRWDANEMTKVFAQDHIVQLVSKAEQLQAKRDYTAAFTLLGQVLSLRLAHS
jgi:hypothetical protein